MSDNQGFVNARTITQWAVGMGAKYAGIWYRVLDVQTDGRATLIPDKERYLINECLCFGLDTIVHCKLDLNSMWVGRPYRLKGTCHDTATVWMVDTTWVAYMSSTGDTFVSARKDFMEYYESLPLEPPAEPGSEPPVKVHDEIKVEFGDSDPEYGQVTNIWLASHTFELGSGSMRAVVDWREVTITKLVPEVKP